MKQIIFLLLVLVQSLNGQDSLRINDIQKTIKEIKEHRLLHSHFSANVVKTSKEYLLHERLKKQANKTDLINLTRDSNATIRCYAFRILCEKKTEQLFSIVKEHFFDRDVVRVNQNGTILEERVCVFFHSCAFKQNSPYLDLTINELVDSIAKTKMVYNQFVGFIGRPTETYKYYYALRDKATKTELISLTLDDTANVRCYAFWALCDRYEENLFSILINNWKDSTMVFYYSGCVIRDISVGDFYMKLLTSDLINSADLLYRIQHENNVDNIELAIKLFVKVYEGKELKEKIFPTLKSNTIIKNKEKLMEYAQSLINNR